MWQKGVDWGNWWGAEEFSKLMKTFISEYSESQGALTFGQWLEC